MLPLPAVLAVVAFSLTVYGWGRAAHALLYSGRSVAHAYATGLGLVALSFMGGVLNLIGLASAGWLTAISLIGISLALAFSFTSLRALRPAQILVAGNIPVGILLLLAASLTIFLALNLIPSQVFNHHDDFQTYLNRIVRMGQTGSVSGNPLDLLGIAGFASDAFFQALTMTWLPLTGVMAFDTIFCFVLGFLLLAEIGRQNNVPWPIIGVGVAVYILINPMIVNVSSVYSTAVLVLVLAQATAVMLSADAHPMSQRLLAAIPVGAAAAALVALKTTTAIFIVPFFAICFGWALFQTTRAAFILLITAFASAVIALLPWLLLQSDHVTALLYTRSVAIPTDPALTIPWTFAEAFRLRPSVYGSERSDYVIALVSILLSVLASGYLFARRRNTQTLILFAFGAASLLTYVGIAGFHNNEASMRYAAPFVLIAAALAAFGAAANPDIVRRWPKPALALVIPILGLQLATLAVFANSAYARLSRIATLHTPISYPISQPYHELQVRVLGQEGMQRIQQAQARIPAGAKVFAWVDLPFHMDFVRNPIVQFNSAFFVAPWRLDTSSYERVRAEFLMRGIRYVLVEYGGLFATQLIPEAQLKQPMWPEERATYENAAKLLNILQQFAQRNRVIFAENGMALIQLN